MVFVAVGVLLAGNVLGLGVVPAAIQRLRVVPNEIVAERPYIEQNIKHTRMAYGLDRITEEEFPAEDTLTVADLRKNDPTIKNIRLWDHRPLLVTYAQLQEIRTYYRFVDVDNDRYMVDGQLRQLMLSARELSYKNLPSRIWINERLTYTHGYGVVLGPVNRITPEGLPEFWVKDIPPASSGPIKVTRPEIYYGEIANDVGGDYVFVKTRAQELDYPAGDKNVYTTYAGTGGVPIQSVFRKLLFALRFGDIKILLSNDIIGESRVMYHRQIEERVRKASYVSGQVNPEVRSTSRPSASSSASQQSQPLKRTSPSPRSPVTRSSNCSELLSIHVEDQFPPLPSAGRISCTSPTTCRRVSSRRTNSTAS